jgi:hypothetical protein
MIDNLDLSVIALCPEKNINGLKGTVRSVKHHFFDRETICVTGKNATADEIKEMKAFCPIHKGKDTITSLINVGMKKIKSEWGFIIYAGSYVRPFIEVKLCHFVDSLTDVLYPIIDRKMNFVDGSSNGILMSKTMFKEAGDFPDVNKAGANDFELAKLLWATNAIKHGCKFKGIVGLKVT